MKYYKRTKEVPSWNGKWYAIGQGHVWRWYSGWYWKKIVVEKEELHNCCVETNRLEMLMNEVPKISRSNTWCKTVKKV